MGPVATPAPVPVPTAAPVTSGPVQGACVYMKDAMCFDTWLYTCEGCCTTGLSSQGSSCWDAEYTKDRCCINTGIAPVPAAPAVCPYNKDPLCWDWLYPCKQCCETDLSTVGS